MSDGEFTFRTAAEETWRIFRIMAELVEGIDVMSRVGPAVSIFGSSRTEPGQKHYELAVQVGQRLAQRGYAAITGGGPGIMEAVNKGAAETGGKSVGLNIALPLEQEPNDYQNIALDFHYFFVRKVIFLKYSVGMICLPGGFGTMDEFFEAMTLLQTEKAPPMGVAAIGSGFWNPLMDWMRETVLARYSNISPEDLELFTVTDDPRAAVDAVCDFYEQHAEEAGEPSPVEDMQRPPTKRLTAEGTVYGVSRGGPGQHKKRHE